MRSVNDESTDAQLLTILRKQFAVNRKSCVIVKTCGSLASMRGSTHLGSTFIAARRVLEGALT
jgi:hypothetical protein